MAKKELFKTLDELKLLEKEGKIDKKLKIKEIKKNKQKSNKITINLIGCMIALGAVNYLTKILEKDDLLSNEILQMLYTFLLFLRGSTIGVAIVELFRKVKYESIIGYLENILEKDDFYQKERGDDNNEKSSKL